jgi:L-fucose mutarotase/ribose pyranase (RbsD/FucU family)
MAVEAVASNASAYIQLGCEVPASAAVQEVVEQPTMSGEVETTATGEIEATTGEDAAIVESVVNEVVS